MNFSTRSSATKPTENMPLGISRAGGGAVMIAGTPLHWHVRI